MSFLAALVFCLAQERPAAQGEVLSIDGRVLRIAIKRDGGKIDEMGFKIPEEAAVIIDGEKGKLADLKPGRFVRIFSRAEVVHRVETKTEKGAAKVPEVPKPEPPKPPEVPKAPEAKAPPKPPEPPKVEAPKAQPPKPPDPPKAPEAKPVPPPPPPPPPEPPKPFPVDESIVPKTEKFPDLGGRVLSIFEDGPTLLITLRQNGEETPFFLPKDAKTVFVGLEFPDDRPKVGYLAYAWLKPGSKDTAAVVRFGRAK